MEATIFRAVSFVGIHPHWFRAAQDVSILDLHQDLFGYRIEQGESLKLWSYWVFLLFLAVLFSTFVFFESPSIASDSVLYFPSPLWFLQLCKYSSTLTNSWARANNSPKVLGALLTMKVNNSPSRSPSQREEGTSLSVKSSTRFIPSLKRSVYFFRVSSFPCFKGQRWFLFLFLFFCFFFFACLRSRSK